jgi:hypothetical protein
VREISKGISGTVERFQSADSAANRAGSSSRGSKERRFALRPGRGEDYQTVQRSSGDLTMADPALHPKASWNSGRFESGPITR